MFDANAIRNDFPQLERKIHGKPIVYLDSTATSLKPNAVIEKENEYYRKYTANVFRGIYTTSEEATAEYERVRELTAAFIHAKSSQEIIFTRNTTESINLVAYGLLRGEFAKGDRIVTTIMEHHSNFVPWQQLGAERGVDIDIWDVEADGTLDRAALPKLVTKKTKLVAFTAASNVMGTITPVADIVRDIRRIHPDCLILVDAAQAAPHMPVDVAAWDADFVAFSSHKMLGPTGIGVLWGKAEALSRLAPFNYGGEMIAEVHRNQTVFKPVPHRFEAGTPHIAGVIGFGAAVEYLTALGMDNVRRHEEALVSYAMGRLSEIPGLTYLGPTDSTKRGGVFAMQVKGIHPHDIAEVLNEDNVFIRAGNHCAQPLHEFCKAAATARASFYVYTVTNDIDRLIEGLWKVKKLFA